MKMIQLNIIFITLGFCLPVMAQQQPSAKEAIRAVQEKFRKAIINKDKTTFKSLFYSDNIPWIAVFSDEMVKQQRKSNPHFPRTVNFGLSTSPVDIISEDEQQEEKMWNTKIETDGYLGSIHFNYSDNRNGVKKAYGTEAWDLVRTDEGWKIVSVKYTVTQVAK